MLYVAKVTCAWCLSHSDSAEPVGETSPNVKLKLAETETTLFTQDLYHKRHFIIDFFI